MKARILLPLALAVLAGFAMADEGGTCSSAKFKVAPFMNKPVTAADLDQLLGPVWHIMQGGSMGSYDMSTVKPQLMSYLKTYAIQPIAGVGALFVLVLLLLALLLFWRCFRCLCVVCCQQEAYADPSKVLFSRRLRIYKGVMLVLGLVGCAMAAWGMASLNQQFPAAVSKEVDIVQEFPVSLLSKVDHLANLTQNISSPLDQFEAIIRDVNITGMQADIALVNDFFTNAPTPAELKQVIAALDDALKVTLSGALGALKAEIDSSNSSSALQVLLGHINTVQGFSTNDTKVKLADYDAAIQDVASESGPFTKVSLGSKWTVLQETHNTVSNASGLTAWLANIAAAKVAAQAIDAARTNSALNPFTVIQQRVTDVSVATADVKDHKLTNLSSTISRFNGLWYNNASTAVDRLLGRAVFVNSSIMELSSDVGGKITKMNDSLVQINSLFTGDHGLNTVSGDIDSLGANLTLPDTTPLTNQLQIANQQLTNAAPELVQLIAALDNLTQALQDLQPAVDSIGNSIDTFRTNDGSWSAHQSDLSPAGNGIKVTVAAAIFDQVDLGAFVTSTAGSIKGTMDGASGDMSAQVAAIGDVQQSISSFSMSDFTQALDGADDAYSSFGGSPASLTQPVSELLDTISEYANGDLFSQARGMIDQVSAPMRNVSDMLRSFAADKIDNFQARWLASPPDSAQALAQKYMNYAYYGLMGAYVVVVLLILFIFLFTWKNCPSGLCMTGFVLNILLAFFALLPIFYTIFMLLMRDTCANVEQVALKAVSLKMGNDSMPYTVANYYLGGGKAPDGSDMNVTQLISTIKPDLDIAAMKAQANTTIESMLARVADFNFKERVTVILDDVRSKITGLMASIDDLIAMADYPSISGVWFQFKGWLCCDLGDQLFVQWAACVILLGMAWVVLACGYLVLKNLDGLSDSCCACACYNPKDYQAGPPDSVDGKLGKRLSSIEGGDETVAVININATAGSEKAAKTYEMIDSTPLPPPLAVATSSPSAPVMGSPRMYPSISSPPVQGGAFLPQPSMNEVHQQRASLMGPAMYASPGQVGYGYAGQQAGGYMQQQQQAPQQQGWGRTSPAPSGGSYPRI